MDKWIKFSEKMPVERETAFAKFYGTDKWRKGMVRTACFDLLITVEHNGERFVEHGWTTDGVPGTDYMRMNKDAVAIAYMHYPEPYREKKVGEIYTPGKLKQCRKCLNMDVGSSGCYCIITGGPKIEGGYCGDYEELNISWT